MKQRIKDFLLERRIKRLARELCRASASRNVCLLRVVRADFEAAINARSPAAWARIEAKRIAMLDPHARAVLQQESRA
jgi:hypothetical protein